MDFVVLISVLAITQTLVLARSADRTKRSEMEDEDSYIYKFPTEMKPGFTVTINGTINENKTLTTIFSVSEAEDKYCKVTYNTKNKQLEFWPSFDDNRNQEYDIKADPASKQEFPPFSIKLRARILNGNDHMFKISFQGNTSEETIPISCKVEHINQYGYIILRGVHNVTSILFEFD